MNNKIKIILADSSSIIRAGLKSFLSELNYLEIIKETDSYESMVRSVNKNNPDYLIFNFNLLNNNIIKNNFNSKIKTKYIAIYAQNIPDNISSQCHETVNIQKDEYEIRKKIKQTFQSDILVNKTYQAGLTLREKSVVTCIAKGMTNKEIADTLFISIHTVVAHRKNITKKLGIKTVSGLTVYAILNKLVKLDNLE